MAPSPPICPPYPLILKPTLLPKVWGGRRLTSLGKSLPEGALIGESWELADLAATSASGAGGQAVRSVIAEGPLAGSTLHQALAMWPREILGDVRPQTDPAADGAAFPLLIKFLDASQNLSVQVHPSPAYAGSHPGTHLKTESWYILAAEPTEDGQPPLLYIGLRPGASAADFAAAARSQSPDLIQMLQQVPAIPGECHTLPSGTVHALGAGVTVAEVQTPSDTTFRLYDWGRSGRELHIEQALAAMSDPTIPPPTRAALPDGALCGRLATTPFYTIDRALPPAGDDLTIGYACKHARSAPFVIMVLAGRATLWHADEAFPPMAVSAGTTTLITASLAPRVHLRAEQPCDVLRVGLCT